jgi:protease-4
MALSNTMKNILYFVLALILLPLIPAVTQSIKKIYHQNFDDRAAVAVVPIKGVLYDSATPLKQLTKYFKDKEIKAIVLKIDCQGSSSGTGQAIFAEIKSLKKEYPKPVIVLVENICASGGYYIACAADYIITSPSALVGSIGAYFPYFFQLKDFIEQYKIHYASLQAGAYKLSTDPFVNRTPAQTAMLQELLNSVYEQFIADVAASRHLDVATHTQWGDGKIFTGAQAHKLGLVDALGSVSDAVKVIKEKALIEKEIRWVHPETKTGLFSSLSKSDEHDDKSMLSLVVNEVCSALETRYANPRVG